jgi:HAD superfamily hydrolase (TIGR01490 family)
MGVAFFDVDGTIVRGATGLHALETFRRAGYITHWSTAQAVSYHLLHKVGLLDAESAYRKAIAPFVGRPVSEVAALVARVYAERVRPMIHLDAIARAREHLALGDQVVLLSATSLLLLQHFRDVLPLSGIIAFEQRSEGGVFVDDWVRPAPYGPHKLELAERWVTAHGLDLAQAAYYADSISDLPVLERVGRPCPVNADLRLSRVAEQRGWTVARWDRVLAFP